MRRVDLFSDRLDEIFEQGNPTKAQIIDAFNKANSRSLDRVFGSVWEKFLFKKNYIRSTQILIYYISVLFYCGYKTAMSIADTQFSMSIIWFAFAIFTIFSMQRTEFKSKHHG